MSPYFLPLGLLLAFLVSWLLPQPGSLLQQLGLIQWMVVVIFLVNGYQTSLSQLRSGLGLGRIWLPALLINLLLAPWLGWMVARWLQLPQSAALGLVVMSTVPATLSSGIVMTRLAGGDGVKALSLTILLNLVGVFSVPFLLPLLLDGMGGSGLSPWQLLGKLLLIVLLPFLLGTVARGLLEFPHDGLLLRYLPSSCVIGTVWMSVSASSETLHQVTPGLLLLLGLSALLVHGGLLLVCRLARQLVAMERPDWLALLFPASQKTLPVAVGVLVALEQPAGVALVASILFHFIQLIADSLLASRLYRKPG